MIQDLAQYEDYIFISLNATFCGSSLPQCMRYYLWIYNILIKCHSKWSILGPRNSTFSPPTQGFYRCNSSSRYYFFTSTVNTIRTSIIVKYLKWCVYRYHYSNKLRYKGTSSKSNTNYTSINLGDRTSSRRKRPSSKK